MIWQKKDLEIISEKMKKTTYIHIPTGFLFVNYERGGGERETDLCFHAIFGTAWTLFRNFFLTLLMDSTITNCKFILNNKCNKMIKITIL